MSDELGFEVEQGGEPRLDPEGKEQEPQEQAPGLVTLGVQGWTPDEASALMSALFNIGVMVYGPEWASQPVEFRASGIMAVPLLDRYVPKQAGGPVTAGVGLIAVAGELAGATARRYPIIKRGPRPVWQAKPKQQPQPSSGAGPEAAPSAPAEGPAPSPETNGRGYRLPNDLTKVIPPSGMDASLGGMYGI